MTRRSCACPTFDELSSDTTSTYVIEAVLQHLGLTRELFGSLDKDRAVSHVARDRTSSLPIGKIGES